MKYKLKKNNFLSGTFIATIGIVLTKILGILYVIPFYQIVGPSGGALYGYAYTIYLFFISISSAGLPLAISKVTAEYQAQGYYNVKNRTFEIGKKISIILGIITFILLFLLAPVIARSTIGNLKGGNSISDVTFVIRVISTAILIIPLLSIFRGYFEGHRFMSPPSISQVLEQVVRVLIIIIGSFIFYKLCKFSLALSIGIALFGATIGGFFSYLYLFFTYKFNKSKFNRRVLNINEPIVSNKLIVKKIIIYAIPFIMIDLCRSLYNYVDMVSVVKGLVKYSSYSTKNAEEVYSILSTWCSKFNMILLSVSSGIVVSLIPNLSNYFIKKDKKNINIKINQAISIILFLLVPMSMGISFLSKSIWNLFYGYSKYGPNILGIYIFSGLFMALFTVSVSIINTLKDYKVLFISLFSGLLFKCIFNIKFLTSFSSLGFPAYYGSICATILGLFITFLIFIIVLFKKYKINFEATLKSFIDILCGSMIMIFVLYLISFLIPFYSSSRLLNILIILFYSVVGFIIYTLYSIVSKSYRNIFQSDSKNILNLLKKIKK